MTIDPSQSDGEAIATDGSAVYWTAGGSLKRFDVVARTTSVLATTGTVFGIAVDATNVYWTTATDVRTVPIAGGTATVVASTPGPAAVAVDDSKIYWAGGDDCPAGSAPKP